jgi:Amt family ammonium transporter
MMCNGMLAGLVAITAPCAFVSSWAACLIGAVAGVVVVYSVIFIERKLKVDDPVGAVSVHGVNGAWGIIAVGLFSNGTYGDGFNGVEGPVRGLFYGDSSQLVASLIGIMTNIVWVSGVTFVAMKVIGKIVGNRVPLEDEIQGLDIPEMGAPGYASETGKSVAVLPELAAAAAPVATELVREPAT